MPWVGTFLTIDSTSALRGLDRPIGQPLLLLARSAQVLFKNIAAYNEAFFGYIYSPHGSETEWLRDWQDCNKNDHATA